MCKDLGSFSVPGKKNLMNLSWRKDRSATLPVLGMKDKSLLWMDHLNIEKEGNIINFNYNKFYRLTIIEKFIVNTQIRGMMFKLLFYSVSYFWIDMMQWNLIKEVLGLQLKKPLSYTVSKLETLFFKQHH
jgi:hypothetical protein